jgi:hypothetical protein
MNENRLTIIKKVGANKYRKVLVLCKCACGNEKVVVLSGIKAGKIKSCGCLQKEIAAKNFVNLDSGRRPGKDNANWKGGRFVNYNGYVSVYAPDHHEAYGSYALEHRLIMEKMVGRPLLPNETVHHKNGIRCDNGPGNLELWSTNHPKGQRVDDLIKYAKEILALYPESGA